MLKLSLRKTFMCKNVLHLSNIRLKDLGIVSFLIYIIQISITQKSFSISHYTAEFFLLLPGILTRLD